MSQASLLEVSSEPAATAAGGAAPSYPGQVDVNDMNKAYNQVQIPPTTSDDPAVLKAAQAEGMTADRQAEDIRQEARFLSCLAASLCAVCVVVCINIQTRVRTRVCPT